MSVVLSSMVLNTGGIMEFMKADGIEFFLDSNSHPTIHYPHDADQKDWPVDSQRVNDLVAAFYHDAKGKFPKPNELSLAMLHIREQCRLGKQRPSQTEERKIEVDPIIQALQSLMAGQSKIDRLTTTLHSEVLKLQEEGKVSPTPAIEPFTPTFGRQLRRLQSPLRHYGYSIEFKHEEDGNHCIITQQPSAPVAPAAAAAAAPAAAAAAAVAAAPGSEPEGTDSKDRKGQETSSGVIELEDTPCDDADGDDSDDGISDHLYAEPASRYQAVFAAD